MIRQIAPLYERQYPTAKRIASELSANRPMLALPRWRIIADIRQRFGCGDCTARTAVAMARRAV